MDAEYRTLSLSRGKAQGRAGRGSVAVLQVAGSRRESWSRVCVCGEIGSLDGGWTVVEMGEGGEPRKKRTTDC